MNLVEDRYFVQWGKDIVENFYLPKRSKFEGAETALVLAHHLKRSYTEGRNKEKAQKIADGVHKDLSGNSFVRTQNPDGTVTLKGISESIEEALNNNTMKKMTHELFEDSTKDLIGADNDYVLANAVLLLCHTVIDIRESLDELTKAVNAGNGIYAAERKGDSSN